MVFVLVICYGLQLTAQKMGKRLGSGRSKSTGRWRLRWTQSGIFGNKSVGNKQVMWMSHGDEVVILPEGFEIVGRSQQGTGTAVQSRDRPFYGLQYHPEVSIKVFFFDYLFEVDCILQFLSVYIFFILS